MPEARHGPRSWARPVATLGLFALAATLLVTGVGPAYGELARTRRALRDQELRNVEIEHECEQLERAIESLESDPVAIERAARRDLRMARPGEFRLR